MQKGQPVTQTGFGDIGGTYDWKRRYVGSFLTDPDPGYFGMSVGPNDGKHACQGDSGSPLLVQVDDGSWRVIGNLSSKSGTCGDKDTYNFYPSVVDSVPWIEKESGIDITPCHDADGTWNPTSECKGFYAGPRDGSTYGTWDNWCEGTPVSGYSSTCGAPFDGPAGGSGGSSGSGGGTGAGGTGVGSGGGSSTGGASAGTGGSSTGGSDTDTTTGSAVGSGGSSGGVPAGTGAAPGGLDGGPAGQPQGPSATGGAGTEPTLTGTNTPGSDAGCGCTTAGRSESGGRLAIFALLTLGGLVAMRRRLNRSA